MLLLCRLFQNVKVLPFGVRKKLLGQILCKLLKMGRFFSGILIRVAA